MKFTKTLTKGKLIRRYKRFFTDIKLNKEVVTAHCPNTGSMMGLLDEGNEVHISKNNDPKRKLKYTLEIIKVKNQLVGVNTHFANKIAFHGLSNNLIKEISNNDNIKSEVFFDKKTRFDFLIKKNKNKIFVEVKNVTLFRDKNIAEFPDAITERGSKHLLELIKVVKKGKRAIMLFLIQRDDCKKFRIAEEIDLIYKENIIKAINAGVEILCYSCSFTKNNIELDKKIEFMDK